MIPIEDLTDVTLAIEHTDENNEDDEDDDNGEDDDNDDAFNAKFAQFTEV